MTAVVDEVAAKNSTARASRGRAGLPPTGEHVSRSDRVAQGKDARAATPLDAHAEFGPDAFAGSGGTAAGSGEVAGARAGADPARPDAGLAVHVLPRGGAADGGGPGHDTGLRAAGAAVRRRAPVELRGVRVAGAAAGLRRQRLRRDPARPVRVGRQAAGSELRDRGTRQRVLRQGATQDRGRGRRELPDGDARLRRPVADGGLVRAPGRRDRAVERVPGRRSRPSGSSETEALVAKARTHDSMQALGKLTTVVDGQRRIVSDPPMIVPVEEVFADMRGRRACTTSSRRAGQVPAHPAVRPPAPARPVLAGTGGPQGRRRRQRRHPRLDRC